MNLKKVLINCAIVLVFLLNNFVYTYAENTTNTQTTSAQTTSSDTQNNKKENSITPPALIAQSAILIDADTGIVLYEKDADTKRYPASITKILTSLITIESCKLNEKVKHSHEAVYGIGPGSSHIGMREGEEITVEQALYGILLASANEVCMAVAEHISGSVDGFMAKANERLKKLGAVNTHFANPHGFHDDNHYTTARDMALIMKEAIKNETFVKIINTYSYSIPPTNVVNETRYLHNSNKFINPHNNFYYEYCVGGKTGFTDQAGNTLVTYCKKDGMNLISVVLKDQGTNTYVDSKALMEYGFQLYEEKQLFNKEGFAEIINTYQKFKDKKIELDKISIVPKNNFSCRVPKTIDMSKISTKIDLPQEIEVPVKIGASIGKLTILYNNGLKTETLGEVELISNTEVNPISEEILQEEENMQIFWDNTITILTIAGIVIVIIIVILLLIFFIKKYRQKNTKYKFNDSTKDGYNYFFNKNNDKDKKREHKNLFDMNEFLSKKEDPEEKEENNNNNYNL